MLVLPALNAALKSFNIPLLQQLCAACAPFPHLADQLQRGINDNPPVIIRDGGVIKSGYDAELDDLRSLSENAADYLIKLETEERTATGLSSLKVGFNRVHGYYIEISARNQKKRRSLIFVVRL